MNSGTLAAPAVREHPGLRRFLFPASVVLASLTFVLLTLGGLVRNAGAGLSCPDWPLCFGYVIPPMDVRVFLEWFHRLIAGTSSVILLGIASFVFMSSSLRRRMAGHVALAVGLVAVQVVLGGLTVIGLLSPEWVSSHLAVGVAFWGAVLLLAVRLRDHELEVAGLAEKPAGVSGLTRGVMITGLLVVYAQVILGGLVSSHYAGLACPDFPTCNGQWVPVLEGPVRLQFYHRLGALITTLSLVGVSLVGFRKIDSRRAKLLLLWVPILLSIQILLGVGSVFYSLPLVLSVAHLATAALLFGCLLVVVYEIRRRS